MHGDMKDFPIKVETRLSLIFKNNQVFTAAPNNSLAWELVFKYIDEDFDNKVFNHYKVQDVSLEGME